MSITQGYTNDDIREFVYEYDRQPFGLKRLWLDSQPVGPGTFRRWRRAVYSGDLDTGLAPRQDEPMNPPEIPRRLKADLESAKARRIAELETQVAELHSSNSKLEATNDALGKAIGLLHEISAHGPDADPEQKKLSDS